MDAPFAFPDLKLVTEDVPEEPKLTPVEQAAKLIAEGKEFLKRFNEEKIKFEDEMLAKKEKEIQEKKNQDQPETKMTEEETKQLQKKERHEEREETRRKRDINAILKDACYSFSEASEILLNTFGAESPKIAESFYLYGSSLLSTVQESNGGAIFSDPVAETIEKKAQVIDQSFNELMAQGGGDDEGDEEDDDSEYSEDGDDGDDGEDDEGDEDGDESGDNGDNGDGHEKEQEMMEMMEEPAEIPEEKKATEAEENIENSVEDSDASSELTSASEEQPDEGETLELAWNILERARLALQKSEDPEYKFLLSEVHEKLADVALESDNIEGAFEEFQNCIAIRTALGEKRSLAEVYFLAGIAMQNEKKAESLDFLQKAQTILEELLMKSTDENKREEFISIIVDVKKRVAEVKDMIENSNKVEPLTTLKTSDGAVRDLGVVGGTKRPKQQQASNTTSTTSTNSTTEKNESTRTKKRKALEEDQSDPAEKKKKTD